VLSLNEREVLGSDPGAIGADYLIRDSKKVQKNQIASAPLPDYHEIIMIPRRHCWKG
jgi:hypothetical protein